MDGLKLMLYTAHNKICRLFIGSSIKIVHLIHCLSIFINVSPSVQHTCQMKTSVQHKRATPLQPKNSSVQHIKSVSSTHPSVQNKKTSIKTTHQFHTKKPVSSTYTTASVLQKIALYKRTLHEGTYTNML